MKSRFGLHIRLHESLFNAVDKIKRLDHHFFQTVLMLQSRQFLNMTDEHIEQFVTWRRQFCDKLFVHGAYWSNITQLDGRGFYSLQKEIILAEKLEFTHMVIHAGAFTKNLSEDQRVDAIVHAMKILLQKSSSMVLVLENSPHKDRSFSSNIQEIGRVFKALQGHDRVKMCVDTAHAYVAGYDISTPAHVNNFVDLLQDHVGINNIALLHCNDTKKKLGSFLDEHAVPGYGNIGMEALYHFVHHPKLAHIPVIFEMPTLDESLEQDIIEQFITMETL